MEKPSRQTKPSLWAKLLTAAFPLYLTITFDKLGVVVVIALLGNHATTTLAAFVLTTVIYIPASMSALSALRGVVPSLAPHLENPRESGPLLRDVRWLSLSFALVGIIPLLGLPFLGKMLGASPDIVDSLGYLPYFMAAALVTFAIKQGTIQALIAFERSKDVMWPGLTDIGATVALASLLVPAYGVNGGGAAFLAGSTVGALVALWRLRIARGPTGWGRPRPGPMWSLARTGLPLAGGTFIHMSALAIMALSATRLGSSEAAAHGIMLELIPVITILSSSVCQVAIPHLSVQYIKNPPHYLRHSVFQIAVLTAITMSAGVALLVFSAPHVMPWFSTQEAPVALALEVLPFLAVVILLQGFTWIANAALIAMKRTPITFVNMLICYGALAIVALPSAEQYGLVGLWVSFMAVNAALFIGQTSAFWYLTRNRQSQPTTEQVTSGPLKT